MSEGSAPATNPGKGPRLSRRSFVLRAGIGTAATLSLGGCLIRCSSEEPTGPMLAPERTAPGPKRAPLPDREPTVRVRIAAIRPDPSTAPVELVGESGWLRVREADSNHFGLIMKSPLRIARDETSWEIVDAAGHEPLVRGLGAVEVLADPDPNAPVRFEDAMFPGTIRLAARTEGNPGDFDIVNALPLETYLPGVLAKELFSHWHDQTFAAQAVAARSFACSEIDYFRTRRHYDVTNTQRSQVYAGQTDSASAIRAVQNTRGMVLAYERAIVAGYYSSCCGGIAANAVDAIGPNPINNVPPLRSRTTPDACRTAPVYRWTIERTIDELSRRLNAYGAERGLTTLRNFGMLASVEWKETNAHGRPTVYLLRDAGATRVELAASSIIDAFDFAGAGFEAPRDRLKSSFFSVEVQGRTVRIAGRGFGHGVGLCQYGAQALAEQGMAYRSILAAYYPQASIVAAYL